MTDKLEELQSDIEFALRWAIGADPVKLRQAKTVLDRAAEAVDAADRQRLIREAKSLYLAAHPVTR